MKLLFMGTPQFGAVVLRRLAGEFDVIGVVTQPDRPAGRKNILTPPPVKIAAQDLGLPVLQVEKLRTAESQAQLHKFSQGAAAFVVASFGMILPVAVLEMPPLKCLNVHASLLPAYRGASPVVQALLDGLTQTGVTIMLMEKGLDTGPVLSQVVTPIEPAETQATLLAKLARDGAELLVQTLPRWAAGEITPQPQDASQASHTGIIQKEAGRINWQESAIVIERKSRAYEPWPGLYTTWNGQTLKLGRCKVYTEVALTNPPPPENRQPGQVFLSEIKEKGAAPQLLIGTGEGFLAPQELQLPGKKMLPAADFLRGYRPIVGAILGS
jgi:methionyl-tRNA formyltransferase